MANRAAQISKADAARFLRAAKEAGFRRVHLIAHPDGRLEGVAEDVGSSDRDKPNSWDEVQN